MRVLSPVPSTTPRRQLIFKRRFEDASRESGGNRVNKGASRTLTSRERALYRTSTGLVLAVMLFSIINFVFNDHFPFPNGPEGAFVHLDSRRTSKLN